MGIELNYRTSVHKKEIIDALIQIKIEATPVLIWQNENGIRKITKAKIDAIHFQNDSIVLIPYSENEKLMFMDFAENKTIYLRGRTKSIVFKQDKKAIKSVENHSIQIFIPDQVKMFEKRGEIRFDFSEQYLKLSTQISLGNQVDRKRKTINAELRDVSSSGMGFFLDQKFGRLFFEKDKIRIEAIADHRFLRAIYGQIVYISSDNQNGSRIRIGIRFNEKLNDEILKNLK